MPGHSTSSEQLNVHNASKSITKIQKQNALQNIKRLLSRCSAEERRELLIHLDALGKCDIIGRLPIHLACRILSYFTPKELCAWHRVSKTWNAYTKDDMLWRRHCIEYSILPENHSLQSSAHTMGNSTTTFVYHDIFRRAITTTRSWETFDCYRQVESYHVGPVLSLIVLDSRRIVSGDIDGTIHVWNVRLNRLTHQLKSHQSHVACLAHDGEIVVSGSSDKSIVIHSAQSFGMLHRLLGHTAPVTSLAIGEQGFPYEHVLFSGSVDRSIRMWCTQTGTCLRILYGQESTIQNLVYVAPLDPLSTQSLLERQVMERNKAGWLVSSSHDRSIYLWDLKGSRDDKPLVTNTIMGVHGAVTSMTVFAEVQDCTRQGDVSNPYVAARKPLHIPPFVVCAGEYDATVTVWSLPLLSPTLVESPIHHRGTIWDIACASIHSKIVTLSGDKTAQVWDLKSPHTARVLDGFDSALMSCAISPQEDLLCIGTEFGTMVIFHLHEFQKKGGFQ